MASLADIKHLVIDMDGVLYVGDRPAPCLREFFAFLRERPIPFILATNNSTRSPEEYTQKLARMGVRVSPDEVLVSGEAMGRYLARQYPPGTRVHVFGMRPLREAMVKHGFVLADDDVEAVVASMDREVTYDKLKRATILIRRGARFFSTNLDPTVPTEEGLLPGTGAMIVALEAASECRSTPIGKPAPIMYELAMAQMGARPETTAAIGDRADTDILGGKRAGLTTFAVLSGSSSREEFELYEADYIFEDIGHLLLVWQSL
jgi:4-nitrophenyl phosphatase